MQDVHTFRTYFCETNFKLSFAVLLEYVENKNYSFLADGIQIIEDMAPVL
jgi:hypothetical protein